MSVALPRPASRSIDTGPLLAVAGVIAALLIGLAFGVPNAQQRILGAGVFAVIAIIGAVAWPFAAVQTLFFSVYCLIAWIVLGVRSVNFLDLLLIPTLLVSVLGSARRRADAQDAALDGPGHAAIREATRTFSRNVARFYGVAVLSLVLLALRGHPAWAFDSGLLLFRAMQGVSLFVLGLWWIRTEKDVRGAVLAVEAGIWALLILNTFYFVYLHIHRAGMTWLVNLPEWPMTSPNEAAASLVVATATLQSIPRARRRMPQWFLLGAIIVLLVMTQSRSGLIAFALYSLFSIPWRRWTSYLWILIVLAAGIPFVPEVYWTRITRTLSLTGGTFEAYSSLMRFYSWQAAGRVFLANPIFGVGYVGMRFFGTDYNPFHIVLKTSESYFLETASGMGLIGLGALMPAVMALWRLGPTVRKATAPGTFGHELARLHVPLIAALLAANITGDNFVGMVGLGQVAIWCAILIRAGHLGVDPARQA